MYIRQLWRTAVLGTALAVLPSAAALAAPAAPPVSGPVRGVTFYFLDGSAESFPWVLANQTNPAVRAKIDNVLASYRAANVNWIRLLLAANHFEAASYPLPSQTLIDQVNSFLAITRSGPNAGKFQVEIVLITPKDASNNFLDLPPYVKDKEWLAAWLTKLDFTNIGMVLLSGDAAPCAWDGKRHSCYGDSATEVSPVAYNNGHWITEIWPWFRSRWPTLLASYEVIAGDPVNDGALIKKLGKWVTKHTPEVPYTAAALYFDLPPGRPWTDIARQTQALLLAYHSVTKKPLWIDEYGMKVCAAGKCAYTEADQAAYFAGFLGAATCWTSVEYPKFAWVAGNDQVETADAWYGLVSGFAENQPVWRQAWSAISLYYNLRDDTCRGGTSRTSTPTPGR
jgi:hypothetical protein